jgi:RNase P/RNase MRP subunit p29
LHGRAPGLRPRTVSSGAGGMRDRTRMTISPGRGTQGRRAGLRAWALAILVVSWTGAADSARADSFVLKSGELVEGSIIQGTRNTLIIRRTIGGMHQMPLRDIAEVRIDRAQGEPISGQMLSWADGVYQIRSGGEVVRVSEGRILSREPREEATGQPPGEPSLRAGEEPTVTTAPVPAASVTGETAALTAASHGRAVTVKASVDSAEKGARGMIFKIELSRPAEQPVVLIYGTLDGTAKAGTDYEPRQGMITLAPGTTSAEVQVPLIEHQPTKGDMQFELFLTTDPEVAEIEDERTIATIQGHD